MSDPFLGEIRMFGGNFAPRTWAFCNGQLLSIAQNSALFSLLGTTYGGDGVTTFGLPNLQSRVPLHAGTLGSDTYTLGQPSGVEAVTLTTLNLPTHTHTLNTTAAAGTTNVPNSSTVLADVGPAGITTVNVYKPFDGSAQVALSSNAVSTAGQNQSHDNMQPFLTLNFIIALEGIFPSSN